MNAPILRDYQSKLVDDVHIRWQIGQKNVLAVMPTGSGKSVVLTSIVAKWVGAAAIVAHRRELISQLSVHLASWGVKHRIIAPSNVVRAIANDHREIYGRSFHDPNALIGVGSVQTLRARADANADWMTQCTLVVTDEAHHYLRENQYGKAIALFKNALILGFTATPKRADGKGLGRDYDGLFDCMIEGPTTGQMIASGALCKYKYITAKSDMNIMDLKVGATGDHSLQQLRQASKESHIVGDVVEQYLKHATGKQGITFATDVETAQDMAQKYRDAGVPAECISAKTPDSTRSHIIRKFKDGLIKQLVNVDLFGEGFDVPGVEVVSMARPTRSLAVFLQQIGRALRVMTGKPHALIIDHVLNWQWHYMPDTPRQWTLAAREKRSSGSDEGLPKYTNCDVCSQPYERFLTSCPHCGAKREPAPGGGRSVEHVDGDLTELDPDIVNALREQVTLKSPEEVGSKAAFVAGPAAGAGATARQMEKIGEQNKLRAAIDLWAGQGKAKGYSDAELYRLFYITFRVDVISAQGGTRAEMEKMRERVENAYY